MILCISYTFRSPRSCVTSRAMSAHVRVFILSKFLHGVSSHNRQVFTLCEFSSIVSSHLVKVLMSLSSQLY